MTKRTLVYLYQVRDMVILVRQRALISELLKNKKRIKIINFYKNINILKKNLKKEFHI